MRALTPEEEWILRNIGCKAPIGHGSPEEAALTRLMARGAVVLVDDGEGEDEYGPIRYIAPRITDLGRLALRVAVPTAGVPL